MVFTEIGMSHVPKQNTGSQIDVVEQICCNSLNQAFMVFNEASNHLLQVNNWATIAGVPLSSFKLHDEMGNPVSRLAQRGDFIRIDIPGMGPKAGKGYDWVFIEQILEESFLQGDVLSMTVRPSAYPNSKNRVVAHFLKADATSTFQVKRIDEWVLVEEHGRNEQTNRYTQNYFDNVRNTLVGLAAKIGLSYPQWKALVSGILAKSISFTKLE